MFDLVFNYLPIIFNGTKPVQKSCLTNLNIHVFVSFLMVKIQTIQQILISPLHLQSVCLNITRLNIVMLTIFIRVQISIKNYLKCSNGTLSKYKSCVVSCRKRPNNRKNDPADLTHPDKALCAEYKREQREHSIRLLNPG